MTNDYVEAISKPVPAYDARVLLTEHNFMSVLLRPAFRWPFTFIILLVLIPTLLLLFLLLLLLRLLLFAPSSSFSYSP